MYKTLKKKYLYFLKKFMFTNVIDSNNNTFFWNQYGLQLYSFVLLTL